MIYKTKGIVFSTIPYSESSLIIKILTQEFGLKSYIVKGARNTKGKVKSNIFQPLQILDLEVYNNPKKNLQVISEVKIEEDLTPIYSNIIKTTLAFFTSEIINLSIKEEEENDELYEFINNSILELNNLSDNFSYFHIKFMIDLADILGFQPMNNHSSQFPFFDLTKGCFVENPPLHNNHLDKEDSYIFNIFLSDCNCEMNKIDKMKILDILVRFFELQILEFGSIKSHEVLKTILH